MPLLILIVSRTLATGRVSRLVHIQSTTGTPSTLSHLGIVFAYLRLTDDDDETASAHISAMTGRVLTVTTISGDFEVRRVQLSWNLLDAALPDEDVRVCTWHIVKGDGTGANKTWDAADFAAVSTRFTTWWTAMKALYTEQTNLQSIKYYREGPGIAPPQPPVNQQDVNVTGTGTGGGMMPPQVAISVTERTSIARSWGRYYLPAPSTVMAGGIVTSSELGRIPQDVCTLVADAANALYDGLLADGRPVYVYRRPLPERLDADGATLAARAASALSVDTIAVDNIWDVIRSRRYSAPTVRHLRGVGA